VENQRVRNKGWEGSIRTLLLQLRKEMATWTKSPLMGEMDGLRLYLEMGLMSLGSVGCGEEEREVSRTFPL
jgi:hypothetical protein